MDDPDGLDEAAATAALAAREPVFHRTVDGVTQEALEAWVAPDFWEVGASGTRYDRSTVLHEVARRFADAAYDPMAGLVVSELRCRAAGPGTWLATYRLRQGDRHTRRVTVWERRGGRWVVLYHQGTVVT